MEVPDERERNNRTIERKIIRPKDNCYKKEQVNVEQKRKVDDDEGIRPTRLLVVASVLRKRVGEKVFKLLPKHHHSPLSIH
jgi:hypothetical protein